MKEERQQKERTSRVIQPSKGGGGYIVDNRHSFMAIKETKGLMRNDHVTQRMVIVGSEAKDVDSVIAADISFQYENAGGTLLTLEDLLSSTVGYYSIKEDKSEGIILTTHGEPGKVGDYEPSDITEGLNKILNINKAKYIYIASCDAATPVDGEGKSVVASIGADFPGIKVCGAPGIAITDYRSITGDNQTVYKKNKPGSGTPLEDIACQIENIITKIMYPDVKEPLNLSDLTEVEKKGKELRSQDDFIIFYDTLIKALLGKLNDDDCILLCNNYKKKCEEEIQKYENQLSELKKLSEEEQQEEEQQEEEHIQYSIDYYEELIGEIQCDLDLLKKKLQVITDARKNEAPLRDGSGNNIFYKDIVKP